MSQLVAVNLALVWADDEEQIVLGQELLSDIRTEVGAGAAQTVGNTALRALRVAPQDVEHLRAEQVWIRNSPKIYNAWFWKNAPIGG